MVILWYMWWFERKWPSKGVVLLRGMALLDAALLEEVCHCGGGLGGLIYAQATLGLLVLFLLPAGHRTLGYFSSTASACTPRHTMMTMDWTSEN